ncbi:MAG: zf-HC2 domain-containing protein [Planctomycetes bacterium]|nr:zf-HC2 domain-containing protein [Planctomycetota bacterium]
MNCDDITRLVHDYGTGRLPDPERRSYGDHLHSCSACQGFLRRCSELDCKDFIAFLDDYVDGVLSPERREVFEFHLGICPDCTLYLAQYQKTMRLAAETREAEQQLDAAPPELLHAVLAALKTDRATDS